MMAPAPRYLLPRKCAQQHQHYSQREGITRREITVLLRDRDTEQVTPLECVQYILALVQRRCLYLHKFVISDDL